MDQTTTAMISVVIAALTSLLVAGITSYVTIQAQREKIKSELRTEFMAEEAVKILLTHPKWDMRSFEAIKNKIGGFNDDELRKLLVRAGAVRFYPSNNTAKKEYWGLITKNEAKLTEDANNDPQMN